MVAADYLSDPDPGVHSAVEWLLRQLGCNIPTVEGKDESEALASGRGRGWYVPDQGHTMVVMKGPVDFDMGSPPDEVDGQKDERFRRVTIDRTFAISTKEVTVGQFQPFRDGQRNGADQDNTDVNLPAGSVSFQDAMEYCNWLSIQKKIPEHEHCYTRNEKEELEPAPDWLSKTGFRLPTEAEWEYACRAGTKSSRHYGNCDEFLDFYGWSVKNANVEAMPVGILKPNEFALFDVYGNVAEWCQDFFYVRPVKEHEGDSSKNFRVIRGGSCGSGPTSIRSASRTGTHINTALSHMGFRVARTVRKLKALD